MPRSFNGTGTLLIGQRDLRSDGSYTTTNFFCLLFFPIFPIYSVRVIPDPKNSWLPFSGNYYAVLAKRWPHPLQVLYIYLWEASVLGMVWLFFWKIDPLLGSRFPSLPDWVKYILFCICLVVPLAGGLLFRNFLLKRTIQNQVVGE